MSLWNKFVSRGRVRSVAKRLAADPTARNYITLANELARQGDLREVQKICKEGLSAHPGNAELKRIIERVQTMEREGRMRELQRLLQDCPRPALWREACDILLESGRFSRAEDLANDWHNRAKDVEAILYRARARADRFYSDRRREDALVAFDLFDQAPQDEATFRCRLELALKIGAWAEARKIVARLLEIHPGDPDLEARFRNLMAQADGDRSIDQALRDVERSGSFTDDESTQADAEGRRSGSGAVRPTLQALADVDGVQAAFYVRGGTALVQGPRGATAERCARSMREVLQCTRNATRKLGLGQPLEVVLEGDFGNVACVPGNLGSSALWTSRAMTARERTALHDLAGCTDLETE